MSKILVSHTDLDGTGPVILAELFHKELQFDDISIQDYGFEKDPEIWSYINSYDEIIIADLSFEKEYADPNKDITVYDHHSQTAWVKEVFPKSVWDDKRTGTMIFWEEYVKPKLKRYNPMIEHFVNLVHTYDSWQDESPLWDEARNLNSVLYGMKDYNKPTAYEQLEPFIQRMERKFKKLTTWRWLEGEKQIIERANQREKELFEKAMNALSVRVDSSKKIFGVCILPSKISLVASRILKEERNLDYLIVINAYGGINGKLSFRSKNGFNCNDLCVANGHDAAAGGEIDIKDIVKFWEEENLSFKYNNEYEEDDKSVFNGVAQ